MAKAKATSSKKTETSEGMELSDFESLLQKEFKPKSERSREAVEDAVKTLAEQLLKDTVVVSDDVISTIQAMIAEIDQKLTEQVNLILHHEEFQKLEGSWRGLHHLVSNTESDEMLKIRVKNISKKEKQLIEEFGSLRDEDKAEKAVVKRLY